MLRSIELQGIATQVRNETTLTVSALKEAADVVPSDYANLETHALAAIGILETNLARLGELEDALGNDFPLERGAEGGGSMIAKEQEDVKRLCAVMDELYGAIYSLDALADVGLQNSSALRNVARGLDRVYVELVEIAEVLEQAHGLDGGGVA